MVCLNVGSASNVGWEVAENVVSTGSDAEEALKTLADGQTLFLQLTEVSLSATLTLQASHVGIRGIPAGTRIVCPPSGGALVIKYL